MPSPDTMHIKFLPHSRGSGRAAAAYLLGDLDHQGNARADVQVLRIEPLVVPGLDAERCIVWMQKTPAAV